MTKYRIVINLEDRTQTAFEIKHDEPYLGMEIIPNDGVISFARNCSDIGAALHIAEAVRLGFEAGRKSIDGIVVPVQKYHRLKTIEALLIAQGDLKGQIEKVPIDLDLGKVAYAGFCCASDGKSPITGEPLPEWSSTSVEFQNGCRCAAIAILNAVCPTEVNGG